jgi:hypothetical protein
VPGDLAVEVVAAFGESQDFILFAANVEGDDDVAGAVLWLEFVVDDYVDGVDRANQLAEFGF